jgi:hypothetical protein
MVPMIAAATVAIAVAASVSVAADAELPPTDDLAQMSLQQWSTFR